MRHVFIGPPVSIPEDRPTMRESKVMVDGFAGILRGITVTVELEHMATNDLELELEAPDGTRVTLARRQGRRTSGRVTLRFSDDATVAIATAPHILSNATYRPQEPLSKLRSAARQGEWTLRVKDLVQGDGGQLYSWRLELETGAGDFSIELDLGIELDGAFAAAFERAAARWCDVIVGDLPEATLPNGRKVDDLLIFASGKNIDGRGMVLGQAGPTHLRWESGLPIAGMMEFDLADLDALDSEGLLEAVILHEMGHVLGIGTLWDPFLKDPGTDDPVFNGPAAMAAYWSMLYPNTGRGFEKVPVENLGGPGTRLGHWRESTFENEIMTGWIDRGRNPMSSITIAALADLGYLVNPGAADDYSFQRGLRLPGGPGRACRVSRFLPEKIR